MVMKAIIQIVRNTHRSARGRRNGGVQRVNVEAQMNREASVRIDMVQGHLDDLTDAVLVDLVHRECLDVVLFEDLFFGLVNVAQADVDEAVGFQNRFDPGVFFNLGAEAQEESNGHAVDVT